MAIENMLVQDKKQIWDTLVQIFKEKQNETLKNKKKITNKSENSNYNIFSNME
jgi:predicted P-loop ATPase